MTTISDTELMTIPEVAALLRCTPNAVYQRHHRGMLPGVVRVGGRVLFSREALMRWIQNGGGK